MGTETWTATSAPQIRAGLRKPPGSAAGAIGLPPAPPFYAGAAPPTMSTPTAPVQQTRDQRITAGIERRRQRVISRGRQRQPPGNPELQAQIQALA